MNQGASSTTPNAAAAGAAAAHPKPIRFVTNNDGPYAKRRRINTACLTCRRKKTRCSGQTWRHLATPPTSTDSPTGERPNCARCVQSKQPCAGYGDEGTLNQQESIAKKVPRRDSNASSNAPSQKIEPIDPHLSWPQNPRTTSTASLNSASTVESRLPRREANDGMLCFQVQLKRGLTGHRSQCANAEHSQSHAVLSVLWTYSHHAWLQANGGKSQREPAREYPQHLRPFVVPLALQTAQLTLAELSADFSPARLSTAGSPQPQETHTPMDIPVYDTSAMSPSPLITQLCKLFFVHLGCCFPFLQRDRFMRDLEEKQVDAILVDAVCALSARFSTNPIFTANGNHRRGGEDESCKPQPSEYGQAFAQRAKSAIPDAFPCPSVAVVQAALLLAYDEFGASRDSGLWMYLGIAIRMAQDLGMHTLEGLKYEGLDGITPKSVATGSEGSNKANEPREPHAHRVQATDPEEREQRDVERERLDTFWSIFFLDRVISSGTGRPVTLRDQEIEISFPSLDEVDAESKWPLPFPALIRIIHLYGRVTDLLNGVRNAMDITEGLQLQLNTLETRLTDIYQNLSSKLHFNAVNFQQYVKIHQGTNFLLLHCWFHTLIVLLHQPTILKTFEETPQSLSANSRELSMSSAKTVADILAFTELIDAKTGINNPFTR